MRVREERRGSEVSDEKLLWAFGNRGNASDRIGGACALDLPLALQLLVMLDYRVLDVASDLLSQTLKHTTKTRSGKGSEAEWKAVKGYRARQAKRSSTFEVSNSLTIPHTTSTCPQPSPHQQRPRRS